MHHRNFSYEFNICGSVPYVPEGCEAKAPLPKPEAYQHTDNECFIVSSGASEPLLDLIDPANPSRGVMITHSEGESCGGGSKRSFTILLPCTGDRTSAVESQRVSEDSCAYSITIPTRVACPVECHVSAENGVCGGNGLCDYDVLAKRTRCFCNHGFEGADCSPAKGGSSGSGGLSAGQAVLVVCIVVLGLLVLLALALLWYVSKLRVSKEVPMHQINPDDAETVFAAN